jgi:hypothetical protein
MTTSQATASQKPQPSYQEAVYQEIKTNERELEELQGHSANALE